MSAHARSAPVSLAWLLLAATIVLCAAGVSKLRSPRGA